MVSVITIFLNGDAFIAEAIESVLAQTHEDWELLLVDDGSSDRAPHIARDFAARFPKKIRVLQHEGGANRGMSASRNLGLQHARGEFISYLDADDVWRPDKLADQLELLRQHPDAAYVYGPLELWQSWTGRPSDVDRLQDLGLVADRVIQPPELLHLFLENEKHIPSGIMVRAAVLKEAGVYEEAFTGMYEDLVFHAKICLSHPVYASSKSWYRYRQHEASCNAQAWRSGQADETRRAFLSWLDDYLAPRDQTEARALVQRQLRGVAPGAMARLPDAAWRKARGAKRLLKRTVTRTRRALSAPPVILCYHRVFRPERDPHLLSVSPENFRAQLEVIRRLAQPLALDALANGARPSRGVVITFDDGYLDNLENALPILRELAIPATIYIATGYVGVDREFWWDDLERLTLGAVRLPAVVRLQINGRAREWEIGDDTVSDPAWDVLQTTTRTPRQKLFAELHAALRPLPEARQEEVLAQLRALTGTDRSPRPQYRCVTAVELKRLAAEPLLTLGAHTITHCDLDFRTDDEQEAEIAGSRDQLAEFIGETAAHFSYPYGSFNESAMAVCARNQFRSAVTCIDGAVERGAHPQRLPRFLVRDWDGAEFERQLNAWFRG